MNNVRNKIKAILLIPILLSATQYWTSIEHTCLHEAAQELSHCELEGNTHACCHEPEKKSCEPSICKDETCCKTSIHIYEPEVDKALIQSEIELPDALPCLAQHSSNKQAIVFRATERPDCPGKSPPDIVQSFQIRYAVFRC